MSGKNESVKSKQKKMMFLIGAIIMGIGLFVVWVKNNNKEAIATNAAQETKVIYDRMSGVTGAVDEQDIWMEKSANELSNMQRENQTMREKIRNFERNVENTISEQVNKRTAQIKTELVNENRQLLEKFKDVQRTPETGSPNNRSTKTPETSAKTSNNVPPSPFTQVGTGDEKTVIKQTYYKNPNFNPAEVSNYKPTFEKQKALSSISFSEPTPTQAESDTKSTDLQKQSASIENAGSEEKEEIITVDNYVPSGTFVRAIMLGGVAAPTGGQAQENPIPMLLEVEDLAFLPNDIKYDIKKCRVIAFAHGDISSERAMARTETLSCIDKNDVVHEHEVKGYIYDESGMAGIRGTLVSKQGQLIANSILAGVGAGVGSAFNQQASTISNSALGSMTTLDPNKIGMAGLGQGVNSGLGRLADYFIKLAEQLHPVIEVSAGRAVDIVFTHGFKINANGSTKKPESSESSLKAGADAPFNAGEDIDIQGINPQLIKQLSGM